MRVTAQVSSTGALVVVLLCLAAPSTAAEIIPRLENPTLDPSAPLLPGVDPGEILSGGLDPVGELPGTELPGIGGSTPPGGGGGTGGPGSSDGTGGGAGTPSDAGGGDASAGTSSGGASAGGPGEGSGGGRGDSGGGAGRGADGAGRGRLQPGDLAAATLAPPGSLADASGAKGAPSGQERREGISEVVRLVTEIPIAILLALVAVGLVAVGFAVGFVRERRRFKRAERDALRDPLTGLANRLAFEHAIAIDWARAARYERPLAVLMLDLDGLKRINDVRGHAAGDRALRAVAAALSARLRRGDLAARLSGDEFVVLATETHGDELGRLAADLRAALREVPMDASIGWAERMADDADFAQLLHRADMAMYEEKHAKRARAAAVGAGLNGDAVAPNGHGAAHGPAQAGGNGNGRPAESPLADPSGR